MAAPAAIDVRPLVDFTELTARWMLALLRLPEAPDSFWDEFSAKTEEALDEYALLCANACAVMADATYPIGMES
ncbi:hypothetical protein [Nocardia sp. NPDC003963]